MLLEKNSADTTTYHASPSPSHTNTPSLKSAPKHNPGFDSEPEKYNPVRGERALWAAVITQAMMDALSKSRNPEIQYHKHEAIRWLTGNSKDFQDVCLLADMDPDYVRRSAKRALVAPRAWRAEAGQGKRYHERKAYRQRLKTQTPVSLLTTLAASQRIPSGGC